MPKRANPTPFESIAINTLTLPNRFVRSATWEGLATDDGHVTPALCERMNLVAREYCASNVGESGALILSEFAGAAAQFQRLGPCW